MELPANTSRSGLPETQQQERDGNNWPGQPHQENHPTQYKEAMELIGTKEDRNAPVAAAIGEESRDDKKLQN